eukprot:CAMPEP_0197852788 /NCGR_PEP_ID=MMETSP1438-20131217/21398_1 /TAXON_ID=1461541 /ORGANISM="Pterosperma sp., Strain CCMP1384" /LENGTH=210 /DNA_ID=CAMNT_0043466967 /DNA_START=320 /DNA_END=952 /DNA_ORIENTATION=-
MGLKTMRYSDELLFITRNPYTRFLSLYLQKVEPCMTKVKAGKLRSMQQCHWSGARDFTHVEDFHDFATQVQRKLQRQSLCQINNHFCSQVSGCTKNGKEVTLIKLELESEWFPCFARKLQIGDDELEGDQWTEWAGRPCYYSPSGSCSDWSHATPTPTHTCGAYHCTDASQHVNQYYTPYVAQLVGEMYKDDFELLGYPKWDGQSKFTMV